MAGFHLANLFEIMTRVVPQRPALAYNGLTTSFPDLGGRANRVAAGLAAPGVRAADAVGSSPAGKQDYSWARQMAAVA